MLYIYIYYGIHISNPQPRAYRSHAVTTELSGRTMRCA